MSTSPSAASSSSPRMVVRGALALELTPGTQPGRAALPQADASILGELVGRDLAGFVPGVREMDLVLAASHFDPAELLRPGWPLHRRLEELHARAPQSSTPRMLLFGADAQGVVPQPLRAELELHGGPLRVLPFLLVGPAEVAVAIAEQIEHGLLEQGMVAADTALFAQEHFKARIEHARYLTAYDLAAMMALQYQHVGLEGLWTVLETALLAPEETAWLDAPPEPLLRYADGAVRIANFDLAGWRRRYAPEASSLDASRLERGFAQFQARQRQLAAVFKVHGLDVELVAVSPHQDPHAALG